MEYTICQWTKTKIEIEICPFENGVKKECSLNYPGFGDYQFKDEEFINLLDALEIQPGDTTTFNMEDLGDEIWKKYKYLFGEGGDGEGLLSVLRVGTVIAPHTHAGIEQDAAGSGALRQGEDRCLPGHGHKALGIGHAAQPEKGRAGIDPGDEQDGQRIPAVKLPGAFLGAPAREDAAAGSGERKEKDQQQKQGQQGEKIGK